MRAINPEGFGWKAAAIVFATLALVSCALQPDDGSSTEPTTAARSASGFSGELIVLTANNGAAQTVIEHYVDSFPQPWNTLTYAEASNFGPGVVARGAHQMEAFFIDVHGDVRHLYTDSCNNCWSTWGEDNWGHPPGWTMSGSPAAITTAPGTSSVDVFVQGWSAGTTMLFRRHWDPASNPGWQAITSMPTANGTPPWGITASSWGSGRIDIFRSRFNQTPNSMLHVYFDGVNWGSDSWFPPAGVTLYQDASVASRYFRNLNVMVLATSGHVWQALWDNGSYAWYDWGFLGNPCPYAGPLNIAAAAPPIGFGQTDLYVGVGCQTNSPQTAHLSTLKYSATLGFGAWTDGGQVGQNISTEYSGLAVWW